MYSVLLFVTAAAHCAASASLDHYRVMYYSLDHLTPSKHIYIEELIY